MNARPVSALTVVTAALMAFATASCAYEVGDGGGSATTQPPPSYSLVETTTTAVSNGDSVPDDPVQALVARCGAGDYAACDELALVAEPDSDEERFGLTCGGLAPEPMGSCTIEFAPPFSADTSPRSEPSQGRPGALLVDARTAQREGFDRFVLEFVDGGVPAYEVAYQRTGELQLMVQPGLLATDAGTYEGPRRLDLGSRLQGMQLVGVDGDIMTWLLDVEGMPGFETFTLTEPPRVVVDVSQR